MSTFDYFLITLPLFCWYIVRAVGKDFAKEICSIFSSVVYNREYTSGRVRLKQNEENILLKIIKEQVNTSLREIQKGTVEFTPTKAKWWYLGGSTTVMCKTQMPGESQSVCVLLTVRYKQCLSVKPWLITDITATNAR